jgi:hypothetical protein
MSASVNSTRTADALVANVAYSGSAARTISASQRLAVAQVSPAADCAGTAKPVQRESQRNVAARLY